MENIDAGRVFQKLRVLALPLSRCSVRDSAFRKNFEDLLKIAANDIPQRDANRNNVLTYPQVHRLTSGLNDIGNLADGVEPGCRREHAGRGTARVANLPAKAGWRGDLKSLGRFLSHPFKTSTLARSGTSTPERFRDTAAKRVDYFSKMKPHNSSFVHAGWNDAASAPRVHSLWCHLQILRNLLRRRQSLKGEPGRG